MRAHPFTYHAPRSLAEAVELLGRLGGDARVLAGGQSLIPLLNLRLARPGHLVDINRLDELTHLEREGNHLRVGALVRHRVLEHAPLVADACPMLRAAAALIGDRQIRARGTIGGSLAHADPAAELATAAVALDAEVRVVGPEGNRVVPARDFFVSYLTTVLQPTEIVTDVLVPVPPAGTRWAFEELDFKPAGFAVALCAAVLTMDAGGACREARIAVGAVGPGPIRVTEAERLLRGQALSERLIEEAADLAFEAARPDGDIHASALYRRRMTRWCVRRALRAAAMGV